jgi:hypothetical protein
MKRALKWILSLIVSGVLIFWGFAVYMFESQGTDVAYQTSDGKWADNEVLFKGRNFDGIVFSYELYKIVCDAPNVKLERITKKPNILTVSWWFDDFDSPKWKVTMANRHPNLEGESYFRPKDKAHCFNQAVSKENMGKVKKRAAEYINGL